MSLFFTIYTHKDGKELFQESGMSKEMAIAGAAEKARDNPDLQITVLNCDGFPLNPPGVLGDKSVTNGGIAIAW